MNHVCGQNILSGEIVAVRDPTGNGIHVHTVAPDPSSGPKTVAIQPRSPTLRIGSSVEPTIELLKLECIHKCSQFHYIRITTKQ